MGEDYIRTARAKGQTERKVLVRHALANAAVPIVTVIGLGVALLIGGVVVTEIGLHHPGPRPAHRRCRARPRLSHHPGRHPAVLARLRADQPGRRPDLHVLRPEDPLLSIEALPAEIAETAPAARKPQHGCGIARAQSERHHRRRHRRLPGARGRAGAVARHHQPLRDQSGLPQQEAGRRAHDPHRRRQGGAVRAPLRHRHARPRRLQPRRLRRARVADHRRHRGRAQRRRRAHHRPDRRLHPLARRHHHARHGRPDGDPGDPARHGRGLAVARRPAGRGHRHRHPRDPARRAPGARHRALDPRGAVRRGRHHASARRRRRCWCATCCPTRSRR